MKNSRALFVVLVLANVSACELLNNTTQSPIPQAFDPNVELAETALVAAPTATQIAAYYCPQIYSGNIALALACDTLIGPVPQPHEMQFHFELRYEIDNPNSFPIPTTEILAAINVFETKNLGAVCAQLCAEGDVECTGAPGENSCKASAADIQDMDDVANRIIDLLILTVDAALNGELDNLAQRLIPAGAEKYEVRVRFSLGIDAMVEIMGHFVEQLVSKFYNNEKLTFEIPYSVYGTLWFEVPILGRVALEYGPFDDVWVIEP